MTKKQLLNFIKTEFAQSNEEFNITTAFDIFFTALDKLIEEDKRNDEDSLWTPHMQKIWNAYLSVHEA